MSSFQPPPEEGDELGGEQKTEEKAEASPAWNSVQLTRRPSRDALMGSRRETFKHALEEAGKKTMKFHTQRDNRERVKIDILVYSTGGLIVRTFLNLYYWDRYEGIIDHVVMCAPANYGSPWARKVRLLKVLFCILNTLGPRRHWPHLGGRQELLQLPGMWTWTVDKVFFSCHDPIQASFTVSFLVAWSVRLRSSGVLHITIA